MKNGVIWDRGLANHRCSWVSVVGLYVNVCEGPPLMRGRGGWGPTYSWMDARMGPSRGVKRPWPEDGRGQGWRAGPRDFGPRPPMEGGWHQGVGPPRFEPPGKFPEPRKLPLGFDGGEGFRMRGEEGSPGGPGPALGPGPGPRVGPPMPPHPPRSSPGRDWGVDEPRPPQFREGWGDRGPPDDRPREMRHPEGEDWRPEQPAPPPRKVQDEDVDVVL